MYQVRSVSKMPKNCCRWIKSLGSLTKVYLRNVKLLSILRFHLEDMISLFTRKEISELDSNKILSKFDYLLGKEATPASEAILKITSIHLKETTSTTNIQLAQSMDQTFKKFRKSLWVGHFQNRLKALWTNMGAKMNRVINNTGNKLDILFFHPQYGRLYQYLSVFYRDKFKKPGDFVTRIESVDLHEEFGFKLLTLGSIFLNTFIIGPDIRTLAKEEKKRRKNDKKYWTTVLKTLRKSSQKTLYATCLKVLRCLKKSKFKSCFQVNSQDGMEERSFRAMSKSGKKPTTLESSFIPGLLTDRELV
eukprot:CAMPEP_0115015202 /NCGR_PEP_ID=MMETSP0216-20121206/26598_1 /TAXON_ID=223996 /ORGANISM="Protocruzia adherens, Strain Boccale" /LENGTH=304 /DNA_ID=CAMNT_0002385217 /DNA_START=58 /DNA_END=969 /DNA_ORIENTATION=-